MEKLAWVRGNDVVLAVTLLRKYTDSAGELHEKAVDFNTVSNLEVTAVNSYGRRFALETVLKHGDSSALLVTIPYTMKEETYALDMKFERDGIHERSCEAFTFKIVSSNEQANVTFQELDGYKSVDLNIKHRMMSLAVKTGQSAYQAWLAAGNTGTLDDYVYYLYEQGTSAKNAAEAAKAAINSVQNLSTTISSNATSMQSAEDMRVAIELERQQEEDKRVQAEAARVQAEVARMSAEETRVQSETGRIGAEEEREKKIAHLESLLEYIKDNHLEGAVAIAEAVKNAPKEGNWVYLDSADGNVKTKPISEKLPKTTAAIYYISQYTVIGNYGGITAEVWHGISLLSSLDLSSWDFTACTSIEFLINNFKNLRQILLKKETTLANVQNMWYAFSGCSSLQVLDTSKWTLSKVQSMEKTFYGCSSLQVLDTSKWILANVQRMNETFAGCSSLQVLDTSKWILANVQNMGYAFSGCSSLQSLDTSKWALENVQNMQYAFSGCSSLQVLDMRNARITKCSVFTYWLYNCRNLSTLNVGVIDVSSFNNRESHTILDSAPAVRILTGTLRGIHLDFVVASQNMSRESVLVVLNGLDVVNKKTTLTLSNNNKPVNLGGRGNDPITDEDYKIATDKGWTVVFR